MPASKSQRVSPQQISEWAENPVTLALFNKFKKTLTSSIATPVADVLFFGEPHKTHEEIVKLDTACRVWLEFIEILGGDWSSLEELEDDST